MADLSPCHDGAEGIGDTSFVSGSVKICSLSQWFVDEEMVDELGAYINRNLTQNCRKCIGCLACGICQNMLLPGCMACLLNYYTFCNTGCIHFHCRCLPQSSKVECNTICYTRQITFREVEFFSSTYFHQKDVNKKFKVCVVSKLLAF